MSHFIVSNSRENVGLKTFAAFFQVSSFVGENVKHIELSPPVILCIFYCLLSNCSMFRGGGLKKIKAPDHPETHSDDCFMVVYGNQMMAQKTPSSLTIGKKSNYSLFSGAKK